MNRPLQGDVRRQVLFENDTLQIGMFESQPTSDACSR
jgi:hypothetical protein